MTFLHMHGDSQVSTTIPQRGKFNGHPQYYLLWRNMNDSQFLSIQCRSEISPFLTINICGANLGLFILGDIPVMIYIVTQASFPRNHTV